MPKSQSNGPAGPSRRLFVPEGLEEGRNVVLRGARKRYVHDVLRMSSGDSLVLFDGSGMEYPSAIIDTTSQNVTLRILEKRQGERESPVQIWLGIALLKKSKMDLIVQKVSELGITGVYPVASQRAVPVPDPERAEQRRNRWQTIAQEASRQSGRSKVTDVGPVLSFGQIVEKSADADLSLLFTTEGEGTLETLARRQTGRPRRMLLLVGPEGGFSSEEEETAREGGFLSVGLGPRILRAETAAILAVGIAQYRFGDLGGNPEDVLPVDPLDMPDEEES